MTPQCETCKHFSPDRSGLGSGHCRHNAPISAVDFEGFPIQPWPTVYETDGCGQHNPKQEVKANV